MEFQTSKFTPGKRPEVALPTDEIYRILGDGCIRKLVKDHYDLLAKSEIREMFPQDAAGLERAVKNSSDFFIQICGGSMYFNKSRPEAKTFVTFEQ
jgi:hemoglobin